MCGGVYIACVALAPYDMILFRINIFEIELSTSVVIICKLLFYPVALCGMWLIKNFITEKYVKGITNRAQNNMLIYIGSSFLAPYGYIVLYNLIQILQINVWINFLMIIIYCTFIIWFCSWGCWTKLYNLIFKRIIS